MNSARSVVRVSRLNALLKYYINEKCIKINKNEENNILNSTSVATHTHIPLYNAEFTTLPAKATPRPSWPMRLNKLEAI